MTDAEKIEALTDLLFTVIHTLEMKQYDIENPEMSYQCVKEADEFHRQMIQILHSENS